LRASVQFGIPFATRVGVGRARGLSPVQFAARVAVRTLLRCFGVTGALPIAPLRREIALCGTMTIRARFIAGRAAPRAIVVSETGGLDQGAAVPSATHLQVLVVLAHRVALASCLILVEARLTTEVGVCVPHALAVQVAWTFCRISVPALLFACIVRLDGLAELRRSEKNRVTGRISAHSQPQYKRCAI